MKEPLSYLINTLLRRHNIKIDEAELAFQLLSHSSYPSLHSVTGVLDHFSIKNYALEVPINFETLNLLPDSFLTFIKDDKYNGFALIHKHNQNFQVVFNYKQKLVIPADSFLKIWSGIITVIDEENSHPVLETKKAYFTNTKMLLIILTFLSFYFLYKNTLFPALHFLLSLMGLGICGLIIYHELGINSKILNKICSDQNKRISCEAVLNSKGANIFGSFKLSDIGIIYFLTLILWCIILKTYNINYNSIVLVSLLAIPFSFYSIYYQYKIVKKWCPLCLGVVSILLLQAFSLFYDNFRFGAISFDLSSIIIPVFCFIISFAFWQFAIAKFKNEEELNSLKIEHYKFKRNYKVFKSLIYRTEQINTDITDNYDLVFCSSTEIPILSITVITNPLCGFCKEVHAIIENLLEMKEKRIRLLIRFNVREDHNSTDAKIALRLMEIYRIDGPQKCLDAMHDIYGFMEPNDWFLKWRKASEIDYSTDSLHKVKEWCKLTNINFTPEILVNGRPFPLEYKRTDLLYFIDDIIEEEIEKANIESLELRRID